MNPNPRIRGHPPASISIGWSIGQMHSFHRCTTLRFFLGMTCLHFLGVVSHLVEHILKEFPNKEVCESLIL